MVGRAVAVLVGIAVLGLPACGGDRGLPRVGERMFLRAEDRWHESLRRGLRLERLNMEQFDQPCGLDVDASERDEDAQRRVQDADVAAAMHGVFGRDWGNVWFDGCDGGRFKIGVPPGPREEVVREVKRARHVLRERNVHDVADLVAVPSTSPALAAAQDRILAVDLPQPDDLMSGQDHSLNAVHVEVAEDVHASSWRALRRAAAESGVNVILERADADSLGIVPL